MHLRAAAALALCLIVSGCSVDDLAGQGYDFSDTLPKMAGEFGKDAGVISVLDRDGDVHFVILGKDGKVHERDYELVCTTTGANRGTSCSKKVRNRERAPLRGERDAARVKLGDLDEDVVDDLRDRADAFGGAPVGLKGNRWIVAAGAFKAFIADLDGSNLHRVESAADRQFAETVSPGAGARNPNDKRGSATGPPPPLPAPPGQLAQGRPDFAAFGEAITAMRAKVGRKGRILFANCDDGIIAFEYVDRENYVVRLKWDPMERALVDAGRPFGDGSEPDFPLSKLDAGRLERIARDAATKERAEKTPGVAISVSGGAVTASMIVHTPTGGKTYTVRLG